MAYCSKCGSEIDDNAVVCPHCGVQTREIKPAVNDDGGFVWGFLGFLCPIAGWILGSVWKNSRPNCAKTANFWAWISFVISLFIIVINMA